MVSRPWPPTFTPRSNDTRTVMRRRSTFRVDELEEAPLLPLRETRELAAERAEHRRRGDDVLRTRMHVAEQALNRAGAQACGARRPVDERRYLVGCPCHVRDAESNQRVLPDARSVAAVERATHVVPSLMNKRSGRAIGAFRLRVLLEEALARALRARSAAASAYVRGHLVEQAASDPACPSGMTHRGEADDAELVEHA